MKITKEVLSPARDLNNCDWLRQTYTAPTGLRRAEYRDIWGESDFSRDTSVRYSEDNGVSFGDWENLRKETFLQCGEDEISCFSGQPVWHPAHGHGIFLRMRRFFEGGHLRAYERYWQHAEHSFFDHTFLVVEEADGKQTEIPVCYEEGASFDPSCPGNPEFWRHNETFYGTNIDICANGDILFAVAASLEACAGILGRDVKEFFPSCAQIMHGLIVIRGRWEDGTYRLSCARPVVIDDRLSSRGVDEPTVAELPDGRVLAVFRGSNVRSEAWNSRISPHAPGYKWCCISQESPETSGKSVPLTFSEPVPWTYDDGEAFFSSATISRFWRDAGTGQLYWIGNITATKTEGNFPRYPLVIARVNGQGALERGSVTVIDTRAPDEDEQVQFSNFELLQDRVTGCLEVYLTKIGAQKEHIWHADSLRYRIQLD